MSCHSCTRCPAPLRFERSYGPAEFLEGYPNSPVWIIGLNPAVSPDEAWDESLDELRTSLRKKRGSVRYFRRFRSVSPWLFERIGEEHGVAHTDLVRCGSARFQFQASDQSQIVRNCSSYLIEQIATLRPKLLIANGAPVANALSDAAGDKQVNGRSTSLKGIIAGCPVVVVMSGFVQQLDRFSSIRLGQEIEAAARELGLMD